MITRLIIKNFLGIAALDETLGKTVLVAGPNAAGKSSLAHAIRMALGGELSRVSTKKQSGALVRTGAKAAAITVLDDAGVETSVKITASGTITGMSKEVGTAQQCALEMYKFPSLSANARRDILFSMVAWPGAKAITDRLLNRLCEPALVEQCAPMLLSMDFKPALAYAEMKQEETRKAWREITGEAYGEVKAETWEAIPYKATHEPIASLQADIEDLDARLLDAMQEIAHLKASSTRQSWPCPCCGNFLSMVGDELVKEGREDAATASQEAASRIEDLSAKQSAMSAEKNALYAKLMQAKDSERRAGLAEDITRRAMEKHQENLAWGKLKEALLPSGIQADLMDGVIMDLNQAMSEMSAQAGFQRVVSISEEMELGMGSTPYLLASMSERWRMEALLSLAMAKCSGLPIVVLDGLDIIEPASRMGIIKMAMSMPFQVVMMATLKAKPEVDGVTSVWMASNVKGRD